MALQYNLAKVYEISENDTDFALQIVSLFLEEVPAEMKSIKSADSFFIFSSPEKNKKTS